MNKEKFSELNIFANTIIIIGLAFLIIGVLALHSLFTVVGLFSFSMGLNLRFKYKSAMKKINDGSEDN